MQPPKQHSGQHNLIFPFWGVTGYFPAWFPTTDRYMVSAAALWSDQRGKFVRRSYPEPGKRMFLDCGGYKFFMMSGQYPYRPDHYIALARHYNPLAVASMDYPCEPEIVRSAGLFSNADRIAATLDFLAYLSKANLPGLVPVIQGYTIDERVYCLEAIIKRGLTRRLMAIGSLCVVESVSQIERIIAALTEVWPVGKFHLFGVKSSYFENRQTAHETVFSFDTSAWRFAPGSNGENRYPNHDQEERRFFAYRQRCLARLNCAGRQIG